MTRRYCGRVGAVFEFVDGDRCPECGYDNHGPYYRDDCGSAAVCFIDKDGDLSSPWNRRDHVHHCELPRGHEGRHECPTARAACEAET